MPCCSEGSHSIDDSVALCGGQYFRRVVVFVPAAGGLLALVGLLLVRYAVRPLPRGGGGTHQGEGEGGLGQLLLISGSE